MSANNLAARHEAREKFLMLMLATPAIFVVGCLLIIPLLWLAWQSVWQSGGLTFVNYARFFTDPVYWMAFLETFKIALIVTIATILLGYPVAYLAAKASPRWSVVILSMVLLPFWTSVLVRSYAWLVLLQRNGIINSTLRDIGLISSPIPMVNNEFGAVIATIHILLPFMVLPLYTTMKKIPEEMTMAGSSLGGSPLLVFARIFFPLSLPGMIAGVVLVFVLTLGFYITPTLLGGGRTYMVSMLVSLNIEVYNEWGAASSISVVLLLCVFLIFRLASYLIPLDRIMGTR